MSCSTPSGSAWLTIPMRGNETAAAAAAPRMRSAYNPMRGNEFVVGQPAGSDYAELTIPMRGNEIVDGFRKQRTPRAYNPHEG